MVELSLTALRLREVLKWRVPFPAAGEVFGEVGVGRVGEVVLKARWWASWSALIRATS
jgi:hypothetical protein